MLREKSILVSAKCQRATSLSPLSAKKKKAEVATVEKEAAVEEEAAVAEPEEIEDDSPSPPIAQKDDVVWATVEELQDFLAKAEERVVEMTELKQKAEIEAELQKSVVAQLRAQHEKEKGALSAELSRLTERVAELEEENASLLESSDGKRIDEDMLGKFGAAKKVLSGFTGNFVVR